MMAFLCFTSIGLLVAAQTRCEREAESPTASLREQERRLDKQNMALDLEIAGLLEEHRRLSGRR